jgi:hypothetical protein
VIALRSDLKVMLAAQPVDAFSVGGADADRRLHPEPVRRTGLAFADASN